MTCERLRAIIKASPYPVTRNTTVTSLMGDLESVMKWTMADDLKPFREFEDNECFVLDILDELEGKITTS